MIAVRIIILLAIFIWIMNMLYKEWIAENSPSKKRKPYRSTSTILRGPDTEWYFKEYDDNVVKLQIVTEIIEGGYSKTKSVKAYTITEINKAKRVGK